MFQFIKSKMLQKKWMMLSLLIGSILLISIACCNPMYVHGALQNLLTVNLRNNALENEVYPALLEEERTAELEEENWEQELRRSDKNVKGMVEQFGIPHKEWMKVYTMDYTTFTSNIPKSSTKSHSTSNKDYSVQVSNIEGIEEHASMIQGRMYEKNAEEDMFECVVSREAFQRMRFVLDEVLTIEDLGGSHGRPVRVKVVGVFDVKDQEDIFWEKGPSEFEWNLFLSKEDFLEVADKTHFGEAKISINHMVMLDYESILFEDIHTILAAANKWKHVKLNFTDVLSEHLVLEKRVRTTMNILQVPTLTVLAIFIFMVASQMLHMEQSEISMLKSRGVSRWQIVFVYFLQSLILALISLLAGIPLGYLLCRVLGVSNSFMEFVGRKALPITFTKEAFLYAIIAALFGVLVMTVPVLSLSKTSIVEAKQKKKKHRKPIWKRGFWDFLLVGISLYGFYTFNKRKETMISDAINGETLDPLLFFSSALFILGCAMLIARWVPIFIQLIYILFKKKWKISLYTAFLQTIRTKEKQNFIIVFLAVTIALGIFNANTARTINNNKEADIRYAAGADMVIQEKWTDNIEDVYYWMSQGMSKHLLPEVYYLEPGSLKYDAIRGDTEGFTKVYNETSVSAEATGNKGRMEHVNIMGIHTKEFGETAWMKAGLTDSHWYHSLNELAKGPDSILMSENARINMELEIGDTIHYKRYDVIGRESGRGSGVICGFVKYFPGYLDKKEITEKDKTTTHAEQYLIVTHFDKILNDFGRIPYEFWVKNKSDSEYMYEFIEENEIRMEKFEDVQNEIVKMKNDPMIQETNGFLTISFLVTMTVCIVGYLIYWILSVRERELLLGIYRAMGLSMKELITMLASEQLFASLGAIVLGVLVGMGASYLYIPLIEIAFTAGGISNLPTSIVSRTADMVWLIAIVCLMLVACIFISIYQLKKLKIAQALKLGEE